MFLLLLLDGADERPDGLASGYEGRCGEVAVVAKGREAACAPEAPRGSWVVRGSPLEVVGGGHEEEAEADLDLDEP